MTAELLESALHAVLQSGFAKRITIEISRADSVPATKVSFICYPMATVTNVKTLLRERFKILHHQEIRLKDKTTGSHVFGTLASSAPDRRLTCNVVTVDPSLQRLFDMVEMGDEQERDRMMALMMTPRRAKRCPQDHALQESNVRVLSLCFASCHKCHEGVFRGRYLRCGQCAYPLCVNCYKTDQGDANLMVAAQDPYEETTIIAKQIGKEHAHAACTLAIALRIGIPWHARWGEVAPKSFVVDNIDLSSLNDNVPIGLIQKNAMTNWAVASGVRLVIRFNDALREFVARVVDCPDPDSLLPGETDEILSNNLSIEQFTSYVEKIQSNTGLWDLVLAHLTSKAGERDRDLDPKRIKLCPKVLSWEVKTVIIEAKVRLFSPAYLWHQVAL
ncbi:expressed unknown protein [Seminavis robusta]|uniref:Uncharacterized protein n=1 Tax=Seminavis robusta TaxID=568900 RepID=A0A9N8E629_9STRA|nr:expressed unknown protein [Seminavis robusta]|eukprot:Sro699_g189500.1 n/a (389) ;mRNA; r:40690-41856